MNTTDQEYESIVEQLSHLQRWLGEVEQSPDHPNKGLTKAGIHKMMARLHDELAVHDARRSLAARTPQPPDTTG